MNIIDVKPSVNEADLNALEKIIGISLPDDLRSHYMKFNGGRPVPNLLPKDGEIFSVQEFLPIKYGMRGERFEDTYKDLVLDNDLFPRDLIPIASDSSGDYFCYSMKAGEEGAIFFNQSDYYDDPVRSVVFLAGSLQVFLDSLVADE